MLVKLYLSVLWVLVVATAASAQCFPFASSYLQGPKVKAILHNGGDMFWNLVGSPGYEVPKGAGKHSAFASGIWVGGTDNTGNLRVAAQTYRQAGTDFFAGPFRTTGQYDCTGDISTTNAPNWKGILQVANGDVLFFYSNGFDVYDPGSGALTSHSLPLVRNSYIPLELNDGRIMLIGDEINSSFSPSPTMMIDTSTYTASASITLNNFHHFSTATVLNSGEVLIVGRLGSEKYDPVTNTSANITPPATPRSFHAAVLLANGDVMISGGNQISLNPSATNDDIEIYNNTLGVWTTGPTMDHDRAQHTMTRLSSGMVLIAGGATSGGTVELYDPLLGSLTTVGSLNSYLKGHSALTAPNGDVYFMPKQNGQQSLFMEKFVSATQSLDSLGIHPPNNQGVALQNGTFIASIPNAPDNEFAIFDPATESYPAFRWQKIWGVSKAQIDQFKLDFAASAVNFANYPDIETWPAHGDVSLGEDAHLAPFVDVNSDGRYRPTIDGDYPCIKGDNALWWVYNDDAAPHTETGATKIGLQIEVMAYTFDCSSSACPDTMINYATFYHYEVTNKGNSYFSDAYMGLWMDTDLGYYADDYVGCDTMLDLAFSYNGDPEDETASGYGVNPPSIGSLILRTPQNVGMTNFMSYQNDFSGMGNPTSPGDYFNLLRSIWPDSTTLVNNGQNGYSGTAPGSPTKYIFPGNPGFCGGTSEGWSESSAGNSPFDRRYLQSFGPFRLTVGEKMQLDYAVLYARGYYNDNLGSVCELKDVATNVRTWWPTTDDTCFSLVVDAPAPMDYESAKLQVYPNPTSGNVRVEWETPLKSAGTYRLMNNLGQVLRTGRVSAGTRAANLSLGDLPEGIYILDMSLGQERATHKIVLQQ